MGSRTQAADTPIPFTVAKAAAAADTFGALWARYVRARSPDLKPSSKDSIEAVFRTHLGRYAKRRLADLRAVDFAELQGELLDAGATRKTVNNVLSAVRAFLRWAHENDFIDRMPKIPHLKIPQDGRIRGLARAEAERLISAAAPEWRCAILLALRTGMRVGELLALRWDSVDLERRTILVRRSRWRDQEGSTKSGRERVLPLARAAVEALRAHPRHGEHVFSREDGTPFLRTALKWPLWRACERAGVRRCGWHALRHTFGSTIVNDAGVPIRTAQVLLGHSTVAMTERYCKPRAEQLEGAIDALERLVHSDAT